MWRAAIFVATVAALSGSARLGVAEAQDTAAAARAFERAQQAQLRGDHAQAARLFELAHRSAPAPAAIRSAIRSYRSANQPARAATLALHAVEEFPDDAETAALASETLAALADGLTKLTVRCTVTCTVSLDGQLVSLGEEADHGLFLNPGSHRVEARMGEAVVGQEVAAEAGAELEIAFEPPPVEPPPEPEPEPVVEPQPQPQPRRRGANREPLRMERDSELGLSPAYTFVGMGVTAAIGAVMVWSLVDTLDASDRYEANPSVALREAGLDKARRTTILGVAASAAAVATLLVAILGTRWRDADGDERALVPSVGPEGGGLAVEGTF